MCPDSGQGPGTPRVPGTIIVLPGDSCPAGRRRANGCPGSPAARSPLADSCIELCPDPDCCPSVRDWPTSVWRLRSRAEAQAVEARTRAAPRLPRNSGRASRRTACMAVPGHVGGPRKRAHLLSGESRKVGAPAPPGVSGPRARPLLRRPGRRNRPEARNLGVLPTVSPLGGSGGSGVVQGGGGGVGAARPPPGGGRHLSVDVSASQFRVRFAAPIPGDRVQLDSSLLGLVGLVKLLLALALLISQQFHGLGEPHEVLCLIDIAVRGDREVQGREMLSD